MDPPAAPSNALTSGTATLLFTDIEGSTRLLAALGDAYPAVLEAHRAAIRSAVARAGGLELGTEGDSFFVVFRSAARAVEAAVASQRTLAGLPWPTGGTVRVRMGLHTGEITVVQNNVVGLDVHRAARISAAAHGGQVLISDTTRSLIEGNLPPGVSLRDLGDHRLKDMARSERIHQLVIDGLPDAFPPIRTLEAVPNNLPLQLTSLVGRGAEIAAVAALVRAHRIVTLTGPGGTGKTRLGLAVAADLVGDFPDGAWFVALAPITDPELVPSAISQALAVPESASQPPLDRLVAHLQSRKLLLVLDNFEQVVEAAPIVGQLLQAAPDVRLLVTSRAVLYVYGEHEYPVPPLSTPASDDSASFDALAEFGAVRLFIERAVTARPDFVLTPDNARAVAQICTRLDGLPLAIELAAARIRLLTPAAILTRLQRRLDLLDSGSRNLPARQRTLRGAIAWSYDLLDESQRRLFARFGIFVGGATFDDAETVCGPAPELGGLNVFDGLGSLLDQSLVRREESEGEPRLEMLETIREFALETLVAGGEQDRIAERHAARFLAFAEEAGPHLTAHDRALWLSRVERELPNVRAALDWLIDRAHAAEAMRLVAAFWRYWQIRLLLQEGRDRVDRVLAMTHADDHPRELAEAHGVAGGIAYWMGDSPRARTHYDEALRIARQLGDDALVAEALYNRAWPRVIERDYAGALVEFGESLETFARLGDPGGQAKALWGRGSAELYSGALDAAETDLADSVVRFRGLDDLFGLGWALHNYGHLALLGGDLAAAGPRLIESLDIFAGADDFSGMALLVDRIAELAAAQGDVVRALRLAGAAAAFQVRTGAGIGEAVQRLGGKGRVELSDREAAAAWSAGQRMSIREAVDEAREHGVAPVRRFDAPAPS